MNEAGKLPTAEKIAKIKADHRKWINEVGKDNLVEKAVRLAAWGIMDYSSGASIKAPFGERIAKSALHGYEDIWQIKEQEDKGWRIIKV